LKASPNHANHNQCIQRASGKLLRNHYFYIVKSRAVEKLGWLEVVKCEISIDIAFKIFPVKYIFNSTWAHSYELTNEIWMKWWESPGLHLGFDWRVCWKIIEESNSKKCQNLERKNAKILKWPTFWIHYQKLWQKAKHHKIICQMCCFRRGIKHHWICEVVAVRNNCDIIY